jgi:predicted RNA-binding protein with PIN domain
MMECRGDLEFFPHGFWLRFGRGVGEALAIPALFALLGLAWAHVAAGPTGDVRHGYPPGVVENPASEAPRVWLVDGFNVVHWGLLGGRDRARWWSAPVRGELLERAAAFDDPEAELWVVFDGSRPRTETGQDAVGRLHEVFAPSADDWLLRRIRRAGDPGRVAVVTADRRLGDRARHRGAVVISPSEFLGRCPCPSPSRLG